MCDFERERIDPQEKCMGIISPLGIYQLLGAFTSWLSALSFLSFFIIVVVVVVIIIGAEWLLHHTEGFAKNSRVCEAASRWQQEHTL